MIQICCRTKRRSRVEEVEVVEEVDPLTEAIQRLKQQKKKSHTVMLRFKMLEASNV